MTTRSWLLAAGLLGLAFALFAPFFQGEVLSSQDIARVYAPIAALLGESLRSADFSRLVWNPDLGAGFPLVADGATTLFYVPHWPLVVALPPEQALTAALLLAYVASALAMAALARGLGHSHAASAVAGLGYGWGGFAVGHVVHPNIVTGLPFLPLVLLGLERARRSPAPARPAVLAGLAWGLQCLGGHPQVALMTASTAVAYLAYRYWPRASDSAGWRAGLRVAGLFLAIGAGVAALYYLPMAELAAQSVRPGSGLSASPGATYSLPAVHLVTTLAPFFFFDTQGAYQGAWNPAEMAIYPGVVVLLLAGVALAVKRRSPEVRFFAALAVVGFVLALGDATPAHRLLEALPVFRNMRAPARYFLLAHVGLSLLAAAGVDALRGLSARQRRWSAAAAAALALVTLGLVSLGPQAFGALTNDRWQDLQAGVLSLLWPARRALPILWLALAAVALGASPERRPALLAGLLAGLVALDHGTFAATALRPHWVAADRWLDQDAARRADLGNEARSGDGARTYVVTSPEPWRGASNRALTRGYRGLDLYVSLPLRRHSDYMQAFWLTDQASPALLQAAAVGRVEDGWQRPLDPRWRLEGAEFSSRWPIAVIAPRERVLFDLAGIEATKLCLVTALQGAATLSQESVAARLRLLPEDGAPAQPSELRAGIETAERRVDASPRHTVPGQSLSGWSRLDQRSEGRFYLACLERSEARRWAGLEVEYVAPAGRLLVFGGTVGSPGSERALTPFMADPYARESETSGRVVYRVHGARSRATAVHRLVRLASAAAAIRRLADGGPDVLDAVGVEDTRAPEPEGRGPSHVALTSDGPLRVELRAEMEGSGYVVLADALYPGWEADVDGVRAPIYAAEGLFRAVFVPGGTHRIVFRYVPRSLWLGLALCGVTLAAAAVLIARDRSRRYS